MDIYLSAFLTWVFWVVVVAAILIALRGMIFKGGRRGKN